MDLSICSYTGCGSADGARVNEQQRDDGTRSAEIIFEGCKSEIDDDRDVPLLQPRGSVVDSMCVREVRSEKHTAGKNSAEGS